MNKYISALLDLAFEFRDDKSSCKVQCLECPLSYAIEDAKGTKVTLCQILISLINNEEYLTKTK